MGATRLKTWIIAVGDLSPLSSGYWAGSLHLKPPFSANAEKALGAGCANYTGGEVNVRLAVGHDEAVGAASGVLFARVGGVFGLWVMGLPFTISAGVGFVALAGASMLEGLVLVSAIRERMAQGLNKREAIEEARLTRLRPVLMTGLVAALGFVPMMLSTGIGSEVQRPLATVVMCGILCDTFLTMLALPVLYLLFGKEQENPPGELGSRRGA